MWVGLWALLAAGSLQAQDDAPLRVAIKPLTPFVNVEVDNTYSGFSIDLWDEIARRAGLDYTYVPLETVAEVLDAVAGGEADVGLAGISITREREEVLDFSQPMFNSGLRIMTALRGGSSPLTLLASFFTPQLLLIVGVLLAVIVAVGHLIWLFERHNPEFPDAYLPGVGEGIWWAASALVGSSDKMPRSPIARAGAIAWVLSGIILVSVFTANVTTQNTIQQLESSIRGLDDLPGKRIATVEGTTAAAFLREERLIFAPVASIEDAYRLLANNTVDAVVYDAPVLQYYALTEGRGRVTLTGALFARQDYGIALQAGSPLRESIDRALLEMHEDGTYDDLYQRWFGSE